MPNKAKELAGMLGLEKLEWKYFGQCLLNNGHKLKNFSHLFSKVEDEVIEAQTAKLKATRQPEPVEGNIEPTPQHTQQPRNQ